MPKETIWTESLKEARAAYRDSKSGEHQPIFEAKEYVSEKSKESTETEKPAEKPEKATKAEKGKKKAEK